MKLRLQNQVIMCLVAASVHALPKSEFYPWDSSDHQTGRADDNETGPIALPSPFRFFNKTYDAVYVSTSMLHELFITVIVC
jgi:hypothetical protein